MDLGRCIVRITAYAGQALVRVQYTFVLNRIGANSVLSDMGVEERFEYDFGGRYQTAFGVPKSTLKGNDQLSYCAERMRKTQTSAKAKTTAIVPDAERSW